MFFKCGHATNRLVMMDPQQGNQAGDALTAGSAEEMGLEASTPPQQVTGDDGRSRSAGRYGDVDGEEGVDQRRPARLRQPALGAVVAASDEILVLETSPAPKDSGDARTVMLRPQYEMSNGTNTSYESMHAAGNGGVQGQHGGQPMGSGSTAGASTTQGLDASHDPVRVSGIPHGPDVWRGRVRVRWPSYEYRADAAVRAQVHRQPGEPLGVEPLHPGL